MGSRAEQINQIITKRRPLALQILNVEGKLVELRERMESLRTLCSALADQLPELQQRLATLNARVSELENEAEVQRIGLTTLRSRFERDTLNVGVVGLAGQGKSRLLQSLSGLSASEIPDGSGGHCTGVRSAISHREGDTSGDVYFHTEHSFLNEVVYPYFDKLALTPKPLCLEDFNRRPLPELPETVKDARAKAMYEHLKAYHQNFAKYSPLLRQASPIHVSREHIREYVAQDDRAGNRVFFNFMAVKEVRIWCSFPRQDVGRVSLLDMPGLGDTGVGDQERLIATLGREVDLVLFVRMPSAKRGVWSDFDVDLYDTADKALREDLPIRNWSFMVLNRTNGSSELDNLENCRRMRDDLPHQHIEVADSIIVNCSAPEETCNLVLDRILKHLAESIVGLDSRYAARRQDSLLAFRSKVASLLDDARSVLGAARGGTNEEYHAYQKLFEELWGQITYSLTGLLRDLRSHRDDSDADYCAEVNRILQDARQNPSIPAVGVVERKAAELDGVSAAYLHFLTLTRSHLSRRFLDIDRSLSKTIQARKQRVVDVLRKDGKLENISGFTASDEQFLSQLAAYLRKEFPQLEVMTRAFAILSDFQLSYRGLIQHRIRGQLDKLDQDSETRLPIPAKPTAHEVAAVLETAYLETLAGLEDALLSLDTEPSRAVFAMIEEFVDQSLRSEGAKQDWDNFYYNLRGELWPKQFDKIAQRTRLRSNWDESVRRMEEANEERLFKFLEVRL